MSKLAFLIASILEEARPTFLSNLMNLIYLYLEYVSNIISNLLVRGPSEIIIISSG